MDIDAYDACDATGLAALIAAREVSAAEAFERALERAATLNPRIGAIARLAEEAGRATIASGPVGPLAGVPFVVKDLSVAAHDLPGHHGSRLSGDVRSDHDDAMMTRMRATGLVPFARTTSPEGGIGVVTEAAVYGAPTRNPWNLGHTPGGSSGGSGAVVAAGIVPAAHGSDGGGSVRIPASCCGLVGFKPTRARLPSGPDSGEGWAGMATGGFLTRSVRDTALLLDACSGDDSGTPYSAPPLRAGGFMAALARPPRPLKIGVCTGTFDGAPIDPECRAAVEGAAALLSDLGHHVEEARPQADQRAMMKAWTDIVACGTWKWVRAAARAQGRTDHGFGLIETVARGACLHAMTLDGADYLAAVSVIHAFGRDMARFFDGYDILLNATLAEPPAAIGRFAHARPEFEDFVAYRTGPGGCFDYSPFTAVFNASGQPAVTLPLHMSAGGLPIGVHLAAAFGEDELLMALCGQIEAAAPWAHRRPAMAGV